MLKKKAGAFLLASMVILAGCGSKLNGTYGSDMASYTFNRNGTVVMDTFGTKVELKYELDGKDVKIIAPQGTMIMTLVDENTIQGPMGMKLTKKKE